MSFLKRLSTELGLEFKIEYPVTHEKPVIIMTLTGTDPDLKSIILNSHMDVVPVFEVTFDHTIKVCQTNAFNIGILDS